MMTLYKQSIRHWLLIALMLIAGQSLAHIQSEKNLFPDIKDSEARFDIVVMVAAGVVPETKEFGPDQKLSRADLAAWAATVAKLVESSEKPDTATLSKAALEKGLVKSIEGDATYAELNAVFLQGKDQPAEANAVPTRGQAASYLARGMLTAAEGSLVGKAGLQAGPTGVVSKVESRTNPDGGSTNYMTIGDQTLPVYTHGKVGNGPTDLAKWNGLNARRTFIRKVGEISVWAYLESDTAAAEEAGHDHSTHKH